MNKNNHSPLTEVPIRFFTWNPDSRVLSTEMSTLEANGFRINSLMEPVYLDAADVGFSIVGKNQTVRFIYEKSERDRDGERISWNFRNERSHNPNEAMADLRVIIFND